MYNLNLQTSQLLGIPPILPPTFIQPLINAYLAMHPIHSLNLNVFAEPYYGDFNNCSAVLMTYNPGQATITNKGRGSIFDIAISDPQCSITFVIKQEEPCEARVSSTVP